jgi:hypothetical protein
MQLRLRATALGVGVMWLTLSLISVPATAMGGSHARTIHGATESGTIAGRRWEASVASWKDHQGDIEPCMTAVLVGQSNTVCGTDLGQAPLLSARSVDLGESKLAVTAMGFSLITTSVRVWLRGRSSHLVPLRRLSLSKSQGAGIDRLSYGGFAYQGHTCVTRLQGLDSHRRAVGRPLRMDCLLR